MQTKTIKMRKFFILLILISISTTAFSQKKKTLGVQPYSIANIKLGMPINEFFIKYPDSIKATSVQNSTKNFTYDKLKINNIDVYDVLVTFYKDKLINLYFKTDDPQMHWGLKAKYGYDEEKEYQQFYNGEDVTIGGYGIYNDHYGLTHVKYTNGEGFIMKDRKTEKLSLSEGF